MPDPVERICSAGGWPEYYNAYRDAYRLLIERRWALGKGTFVNQLHHTAIPDASGATTGLINWAFYSQPSSATLREFLAIFSQLLTAEPHRIRSSRYIFVVPSGMSLPRADVCAQLVAHASRMDFWCDSIEAALAVPDLLAPLDSINALIGTDDPALPRVMFRELQIGRNLVGPLQELRSRVLRRGWPETSIIPRMLWRYVVDSAFVLTAFRLGLDTSEAAAICSDGAGLSAQLAADRARDAGWGTEAMDYCARIISTHPPKTVAYTVKPGDMLSLIVRERYEVSFNRLWPLIRILNPEISNPNLIIAGRTLKLPELDEEI